MVAGLREISEGVCAWVHDVADRFTCNVGVVVEDDGLTLVDTSGVPSSYEALVRALAVFGKPVRRIVLTHGHPDHVAGAGSFPGAEVIASAATVAMLAAPPFVGPLQALHPAVAVEIATLRHPRVDRVVEEAATIGRMSLELLGGHSGGDLVVHVPDASTLFSGDLCFFDHVPLGIGADFPRWLASVEHLLRAGPPIIVPGHGPVGGRSQLEIVREYLHAVIEAGRRDEKVASGPWDAWLDPWADRIPHATDRINVEQARDPHGFPPTLVALITGSAGESTSLTS